MKRVSISDRMKEHICIDEHRLDYEWGRQPGLYTHYAWKLADARQQLEETKNELAVVKAELYREIVSEPERFGLPKTTEGAVAATIECDERYKDVQLRIIAAKHLVDLLNAYVTALDHKKHALENLVRLSLAGYFATPQAPDGSADEMREREKDYVRRNRSRRYIND